MLSYDPKKRDHGLWLKIQTRTLMDKLVQSNIIFSISLERIINLWCDYRIAYVIGTYHN